MLERIAQYANLDASVDSSARFPPPVCHPGTRLRVGDRLFNWLTNPQRERSMIWLYGPAGTGKSTVAQTFAERCAEVGRLGASFFFSRPNDRNDPDTVIPSLIYHLAVCNPQYKSLVAAQLANDPELLRKKTRRTQFKKLIVEPFSQLQNEIQEPLLVVLDGLDECSGEEAQRDFIEMISEVVRLKENFPLIWLICSRPEAHLKYLFSRADFTVNCGREELVIDVESIADVDFYLRDGLAGIKAHFSDVTYPTWPSEQQIIVLSEKASGHFGFASTVLRYVGDLAHATPMKRLNYLFSFLQGVKGGSSNPLEALDALYTTILHEVPEEVIHTVKQILGFVIFYHDGDPPFDTIQGLCNFLRVDQATFYTAFRRLHSVIDVPSPEAAFQTHIRFYHASFEDYLCDANRSGRFAIARGGARLTHAKLCLSWYRIDLELFHSDDGGPAITTSGLHILTPLCLGSTFNDEHKHGVLPGLLWALNRNRAEISHAVATYAENTSWFACYMSGEWDETLRSQIRNFDFRYIHLDDDDFYWRNFVNDLWERVGSSTSGSLSQHVDMF